MTNAVTGSPHIPPNAVAWPRLFFPLWLSHPAGYLSLLARTFLLGRIGPVLLSSIRHLRQSLMLLLRLSISQDFQYNSGSTITRMAQVTQVADYSRGRSHPLMTQNLNILGQGASTMSIKLRRLHWLSFSKKVHKHVRNCI